MYKSSVVSTVIVTAIFGFLYYLLLPAISLQSIGFWLFLIAYFLCVGGISMIAGSAIEYETDLFGKITMGLAGLLLVIFLGGLFFGSDLFTAHSLANVYGDENIKEEDIPTYFATLDNIPLTDKDTAYNLAIRQMGSLNGDEVSQFELHNSYSSTYKGISYRVAPLGYAGFFQWNNNKDTGIPAYISVNMTNQNAEINRLDKTIKYGPSEFFGRDLKRHLRKDYPNDIFDESSFELDEDGNPYWITPVIKPTVGMFNGDDVVSVIVTNAVTGENEKYALDKTPSWIDNVYPSYLIIQQYDWYGSYQSGFWNSIFGKKNAVVTTEGYNYVPKGDDVYIYTGVTSLVADESNIGFIVVNKRTKETTYYKYAGAEEYSAMSSAEGVVQQFGYTATFPLLVNVEGVPTYYLALKDTSGLVKSYALINVKDYQIVVAEKTLKATLENYLIAIGKKTEADVSDPEDVTKPEVNTNYDTEIEGVIETIKTGDIDGNTYFYIKLENDERYFKISLANSELVIMANAGDRILIEYANSDAKILDSRIK